MSKITITTALLSLSLGTVTLAQTDEPATEPDHTVTGLEIDIPAQPVGDALNAFADQSGLQVVLYADVGEGVRTERVAGRFENEDEALTVLLASTGLHHEYINERTVAVQESERAEEQKLGKSQPTSNKTLIAQAGTSAQQSQVTTAISSTDRRAEVQKSLIIEEVVVTARKREESLQDVPISISVFSAADLEAKSFTSLRDLGEFTPNFTFTNHPAYGRQGSVVFIRGVGQADPSNHLDPGVAVYLDGVYLGRMQGIDLDLVDIERVEILRGPQGSLFGKNTIGGAINVMSSKPTDEFSGAAEILTGRYDRIDAMAKINVPLVPGKLAAKFAGVTRNRGGYGARIDYFTGKKIDEPGDENRTNGRVVFDWTPTENLEVLLSLDAAKGREEGPANTAAAYGQPGVIGLLNQFVDPDYGEIFLTDSDYTTYGIAGNMSNIDTWGGALTIDWDIGFVAVKSITSYRDLESFVGTDTDGTPYGVYEANYLINQDQFSQELQFSGLSLDDRLNWVLGLYFFQENSLLNSRQNILREFLNFPVPIDASHTRIIESNSDSWAGFGQATYNIADKLRMTVGLRYTDDKKYASRMRFNHSTGQVTVPFRSQSESWNATSGTVSAVYQWNNDVMTYVSASHGFKSGGLNANSTADNTFVAFDPEYIWTYEMGLRSDFLDRRLRFNSTLFYSDYTDLQFAITVADPVTNSPISIVGNAAKAEIKGFEIEVVTLPTSALTLSGAIGYTDAEYTEVDPTAPISEDDKLPVTPKWTVTVSGEYAKPLGELGELIGRLDYAYKTEMYLQPINDPINFQDSYGFLNAKLTFEHASGNWAFSMFGTNLTDTRYLVAAHDTGPLNGLGFAMAQYGRPREWGASLIYRF